MAGPSSARRIAGAAAAVLPADVRRRLRRRLGRAGGELAGVDEAVDGVVSVVLVCERRDLPRLPAALASALAPSGVRVEVLVCPVGDIAAAVASAVGRDDRVRVLPDATTWQGATDAAVAAASGDFVTFLRGCDLVPTDAIAASARSLASSGSDLATARLGQAGSVEPWLERAQRAVHAAPASGVAPPDRPDLAGALTLGGLMVRRPAWVGGLGVSDSWITSRVVAALLARSERVDVLDHAAYTLVAGGGTRAFAATPSPLPGLARTRDRWESVEQALGESRLLVGRRRHVAALELPRFLVEVERAGAEEWDQLRTLASSYADVDSATLPAASRALLSLAAAGRRPELEALAGELAGLGDDLRTRLVQGEVHAAWASVELPQDLTLLGADETPLRAQAQRTRWVAGGREVDVFLALVGVDPATDPAAGDVRAEVAADVPTLLVHGPAVDPAATRWAGRRFQEGLALTVRVEGAGPTTLRIRLTVGGVTRAASLEVPARAAVPRPGPVVVSDVGLDGTELVVAAGGDLTTLRLLDPDDREVDVSVRIADGVARLELRADAFGTPTWLPSGPHRLVTTGGNVSVTEDLRGRLPRDLLGERHRVGARLGPLGGLVLGVNAPLTDDELGPRAQERLRTTYAVDDRPVDPGLVYLDSYAGRSATDSPLAIHDELRRRRPDLRTVWGIADHAQSVPAGAEPVLLRSREWYAALATAGVIVTNTDVEAWFRRRAGQVLLQTFHGYPSKAMGIGQWQALDHGPSQVRVSRSRGVDTWSAILTPTPEMTRHYREQYAYAGPAFDRGYPRNDDLVLPAAEATRERTRRLLGIEARQTAVLYAPTWREHLAFRPRGAAMTDHLDLAAAADALGEDHVLLLRAHRFHRPDPRLGEARTGRARVIDVTAYPEINDLVLASDAAVLDYSSLRFDYALTGRPMVFLVPDLAAYAAGSRTFLFPFEESAPGPFVDDTAGVVRELRDLEALRGRHAGEIAAFNARYNPWQDGHAAERVVDQLLPLL